MPNHLQNAQLAEAVLLASAGRHAGEEWLGIISRKTSDIEIVGHSLWILNSNSARVEMVQDACRNLGLRYVLFVTRAVNVVAAGAVADVGTKISTKAAWYSADGVDWMSLPPGLGPVTGHINSATTALWFDALERVDAGSLDIGQFEDVRGKDILRGFKPSDTAYLARRLRPSNGGRYRVIGVGRLAEPFAVRLRS